MIELLNRWFANAAFWETARERHWPAEAVWVHILADSMIGVAACAVAAALIYLIRHKKDMRFTWAFVLFAAFFVVFAMSRFALVWSIWSHDVWAVVMFKGLASVVSIAAAISLLPIVPLIANMPSRKEMTAMIRRLENEVQERRLAEHALRESQGMLRELAAYQERIREDERKRIAREIHDDLGQNLLALRLDISILHARTDRHRSFDEKIEIALSHIDTTMKSVRAIINNLRPPVLDLGLQAAIEWQVKEFSRASGITCELMMDHQNVTLDDEQATAIFRVLQESLTNVKRHAGATHVDIDLRSDGSWVSMTVDDNGVGMYPNERRKSHRFGLVGMAERIATLGGELHIHSIPGQGTALRLSIPVNVTKPSPDDERERESTMML
jgi:signal transduction histidine kinase